VCIPFLVGPQADQGGHGVDVLQAPTHSRTFEPLAQLLAEAFHRAAGDRPTLGFVRRIVQPLGILQQVRPQRLHRGLPIRIAILGVA